ncbi:hypothetical protein BBD42_18005 [Paenibacillus sp. BIHB 4019]|uniref:Uncharacterized protein n=1 Tax=Paenibacillus sp. BIHB 4019 TaxID=1870819 RepID=A0A1B2DKD2_9BACL|nr:hypothetical protein [Paenibacillus sp. BIHB 4019]ANY68156.1 hypothetical protein BBD42_18005 [Paenibacillus sp. BIHB 4019]
MSEKLKKLLEILKELWYLPFVVYYVGFIYVQGYFAPYTGDLFIAKDFLTVYPVSQSLYLINGIFLVIFIAIPIVFLIALPSNKRIKKQTSSLKFLSKSIRSVKYLIERRRHS